MTINSFQLGPGTLKFGALGAENASAQITKGACVPSVNVETTNAIPVLSGEEIPEEEEVRYTWTLDFTALQDIELAGFVFWTWANKGEIEPFEFIPVTADDVGITGYVRVDPLQMGGDVKTRNTSDASWKITDADGFAADPVPAAVV